MPGANPTDRGKAGSKLHLAGDGGGLQLSVVVSGANANDPTMLGAVLAVILAIRMPRAAGVGDPPRCMPTRPMTIAAAVPICGGAGSDPRIARRMVESSQRLGRHRWMIERTRAWLGGFRRLRIRYERFFERFYAWAMLARAVICFNALQQPPW